MTAYPPISPIAIGCPFSGMTNFNLSAAATFFAYVFMAPVSGAVESIDITLAPITAVPPSSMSVDIQGVALGSSATTPNGVTITNGSATADTSSLAGGGIVNFVFATPPNLVAGTTYSVVIKNLDAAPTVNYPVLTYASSSLVGNGMFTQVGPFAFSKIQSTNSGGSWSSSSGVPGGMRVRLSSGDTIGHVPVWVVSDTTDKSFNGSYVGVEFTMPFNAVIDNVTLFASMSASGNHGANTFKVWKNGVVMKSHTHEMDYFTANWAGLIPAGGIRAMAGDKIIIAASQAAGSSTAYLRTTDVIWDGRPYGARKIFSTDGVTWGTSYTDRCPIFGAYCSEILPAPLNRRKYFNQR